MTKPRKPTEAGKMPSPASPRTNAKCAPLSTWQEIVAGTISEEIAMVDLHHAAGCRRCSDRLREVLPPNLRAATPGEEAFLQQLATSSPESQRGLAARMFATATLPNHRSGSLKSASLLSRLPKTT